MADKKQSRIPIFVWVLLIAMVVTIGMVYFPREYQGLGFFEALYSTLRLFVFERDLGPFPRSWPLIMIYFLAPLITLSVLGTIITYFLRMTPAIRTWCTRDHVVICGVGQTGKLLCRALRAKGVPIVGVDMGSRKQFDEFLAELKLPMVFGDFHSRLVLGRAKAPRARSVVYATGDDLDNLEGAARAYEWLRTRPHPPMIWAHIANERLVETAKAVLSASGSTYIRFFDTYRIAAQGMVDRHLRCGARNITEAYVLGFGKFGRDLFEVLIRCLDPQECFPVQVIDKQDRQQAVGQLAAELGVADRVSFRQMDINELKPVGGTDQVFFVCTDDDLGNITTAMMLAEKSEEMRIFVRMTHWPIAAVAEHLGSEKGVVFVNIQELVIQAIQRIPGILERNAKGSG